MITFKDFLNEAPLPDTWDKDKFKQRPAIKTFRDIIEYASEKAAEVGRGSSRVAFKIDYKNQDTVLKIAKNEKGLSQNKQEIGYLSDDFIKNLNITIPMIDYDTDNVKPKWIHTELADKAEEQDFINELNVTLKEFVLFCRYSILPSKNLDKDKHDLIDSKINKNSNLYKSFTKLLQHYHDLEAGDLLRIENWGIYKNKLVIIDIGFDSTSKALYSLSK